MHNGTHAGRVEVISGVMFSGKSEELLRRLRLAVIARKRIQVFTSHVDDRHAGVFRLSSHDGSEIDAHTVSYSRQIRALVNPETDVVGIDEVHVLDDGIVGVVQWLADRHVRVIVAGTDLDFRGRPLGSMGALLAIAEVVDKLHAICVKCGGSATRTQRLLDGKPDVTEGPAIRQRGSVRYEARCRKCH